MKSNLTMDIKLTRSKINLLEAQLKQFNECGYFSDEEIARLTKPVKEELAMLHPKLTELTQTQAPENIDVVDHKELS